MAPYTAIKNIAKKRADKVLAYKEKFLSGFREAILREGKNEEEAEALAQKLWQIVEDSAAYSFNACVTGDTRIQRAGQSPGLYEPSIEEMYLIMHDRDYAKNNGHLSLRDKYRRKGYGRRWREQADPPQSHHWRRKHVVCQDLCDG